MYPVPGLPFVYLLIPFYNNNIYWYKCQLRLHSYLHFRHCGDSTNFVMAGEFFFTNTLCIVTLYRSDLQVALGEMAKKGTVRTPLTLLLH